MEFRSRGRRRLRRAIAIGNRATAAHTGGFAARSPQILWEAASAINSGITGNLGFGVGLAAPVLGFEREVHTPADANPWKQAHLRKPVVAVVERPGRYPSVAAAHDIAASAPRSHVVGGGR